MSQRAFTKPEMSCRRKMRSARRQAIVSFPHLGHVGLRTSGSSTCLPGSAAGSSGSCFPARPATMGLRRSEAQRRDYELRSFSAGLAEWAPDETGAEVVARADGHERTRRARRSARAGERLAPQTMTPELKRIQK